VSLRYVIAQTVFEIPLDTAALLPREKTVSAKHATHLL